MKKKLYRSRAIRLKCLDCCCGSSYEVKLCNIKDCSLWPYRNGHAPKPGTEEEARMWIETDEDTPPNDEEDE